MWLTFLFAFLASLSAFLAVTLVEDPPDPAKAGTTTDTAAITARPITTYRAFMFPPGPWTTPTLTEPPMAVGLAVEAVRVGLPGNSDVPYCDFFLGTYPALACGKIRPWMR